MIEWKDIAADWLNEYAHMGVFVVDPDFKVRFWNRWMADHTGKSAKFVMGKPLFSICPEIETRKKSRYYREALSGKTALLAQKFHHYLIPMPAGCTTHSFECMQQTISIVPLKLADQVVNIVTIIEDVTERLEQEQDLTVSRNRYRMLLESARDAIVVLQGSRILEPNLAARSLFGLSGDPKEQEKDFCRFREAIDPDIFSRLTQWHGEGLGEESPPKLISFQISDPNGKKRWMESNSVAMTWEGKPAILVTLRDITRRKEAEMALEAERKRLAVTLRTIGDGVIATDTEGRVILINRAAEEMTGWSFEEALGEPLPRVFPIINQKTRETCENPVEKVLETGLVVGLANHTVLIAKDGTERMIADSGSPIEDKEGNLYGVVLVFQDVTEKHQMEAEVARTRNLESLGLLAGGIAHDFNNILAVILGNVQLMKQDLETPSEGYECASEAEQAVQQAKALARQLLTFAKGGAPIKKIAVLSDAIRESGGFAVRGSNLRCEYAIDEALWSVDADVEQMGQVLGNLFINAKQAMPQGGCIRVGARNETLDQSSGIPLEPGPFVSIIIQDEGTGIPEEHLQRIFDPYFTTKQTGSGLGLATSRSIIQRHGGHISAASEPGKGTTFTIHLPASDRTPVHHETTRENLEPAMGTGTILVMDDDPGIRKMASRQLERLGYRVAVAEDGKEAISIYGKAMEENQRFSAVIMDLTIPGGMGGKEAVRELLKLDPKAVVLVSSGYANDPMVANCTAFGFKGAVPKPFTLKELGQALENALKGKGL